MEKEVRDDGDGGALQRACNNCNNCNKLCVAGGVNNKIMLINKRFLAENLEFRDKVPNFAADFEINRGGALAKKMIAKKNTKEERRIMGTII